MKQNRSLRTKDMTYIGIGLAALIGGGIVIYQISSIFAVPGVKYMLMAPYLSIIMYVLMSKVEVRYPALVIGTTFGLIMMLMNVFMTVSIILTSILTEVSLMGMRPSLKKRFIGAAFFSGYSGLTALLISKYAIGGVFEYIPLKWIGAVALICTLLGMAGAQLGQRIMKYVSLYHGTS